MDLSIIIPAYNEEKRIGLTLEKTLAFLARRPWSFELLVVDDGSTDAMPERVRHFERRHPQVHCLRHAPNRGKGYAVRCGVRRARGEFIGFMDADYKTEVAALDAAMQYLGEGWDGVIGDRTLSASRILVARRRHRQWGAMIFRRLFCRLLGLEAFGDTQCGFKFFRAEVMRDLFSRQRVDGFMFDVEILLLARRSGYRVRPLAVEWRDDPDSRFKALSGTLRNLGEMARIRWIHR